MLRLFRLQKRQEGRRLRMGRIHAANDEPFLDAERIPRRLTMCGLRPATADLSPLLDRPRAEAVPRHLLCLRCFP